METSRSLREIKTKKYMFRLFDGYQNKDVAIYAESYDAAINRLGILPPGYILSQK